MSGPAFLTDQSGATTGGGSLPGRGGAAGTSRFMDAAFEVQETTAGRPDNGPLSLFGLMKGCLAEVLAVLKLANNAQ